ncbi:hypothetical protein [Rhodoflexus caldus]|uniref:hypothetical protein n=1 Tax=Rhodoflexus caldus TaxID=2891236 RepID=UPI00202A3735|nr:hypothetical protein [Rhodoflexus caldus]
MSIDIKGILSLYQGKEINFLLDADGKEYSDKEARQILADLLAKGHKLIPMTQCEGFDPFGGGCPGHPIDEDEAKSDKFNLKKALKQQKRSRDRVKQIASYLKENAPALPKKPENLNLF